MSSAHRIHLKGPWECRWLGPGNASPESAAATTRVKMPADWKSIFGEQVGSARFTRRFHKPTGLEPTDSVWLLFDGIGGDATIQMNGQLLQNVAPSSQPSLAFEITGRMEPANEIAVDLTFDPQRQSDAPGGLWGPVLIVIVSG